MRAITTPILIVVTTVVILITAVVILTIFIGGMPRQDQRGNCLTLCTVSCESSNIMPPTWEASGCSKFTDVTSSMCHCCPQSQKWCPTANSGTGQCADIGKC